MTTTNTPDLPIPVGATAGDWDCVIADEPARSLLWSKHDAGKIGVAVDGWQYGNGEIDRHISLYDTDCKELTPADARALAAALLDAADALDALR